MLHNKLIVCDVCDTLFNSNTTFDFLKFVARENGTATYLAFNLVASKFSPLFYFLVLAGRVLKKDLVRNFSLLFLKNFNRTELLIRSERFYDDFLVSRINHSISKIISDRDDKSVILLSSSIDVVVEVIAKKLDLEFFSSQLEFKNGIATGRLQKDLTGEKHKVVESILDSSQGLELTVITDNKSDLRLMKMADQRVAVIRSDKQKLFWRELNPIFIKV